jgi:hypothetical protein
MKGRRPQRQRMNCKPSPALRALDRDWAHRVEDAEKESGTMADEWTSVGDERSGDEKYVSWARVRQGTAFEGTYAGVEKGSWDNDLIKLSEWKEVYNDGVVHEGDVKLLPAFTSLARQIAKVRLGAPVKIVFMGSMPLKGGKTFNMCDVQVRRASDLLPSATASARDDDDLPF